MKQRCKDADDARVLHVQQALPRLPMLGGTVEVAGAGVGTQGDVTTGCGSAGHRDKKVVPAGDLPLRRYLQPVQNHASESQPEVRGQGGTGRGLGAGRRLPVVDEQGCRGRPDVEQEPSDEGTVHTTAKEQAGRAGFRHSCTLSCSRTRRMPLSKIGPF